MASVGRTIVALILGVATGSRILEEEPLQVRAAWTGFGRAALSPHLLFSLVLVRLLWGRTE